MYERAFPDAEIHPRQADIPRRLLRNDIDYQTPFTELARWLRPNLIAAVRPEGAYLTADAALAASCRSRYRALGDGPVVGIAWASGNLRRPDRNAPLPLWDPILKLPGLTFLSLQYGDHADAIAEVRDRLGVTIHEDPEIDQLKSLEQFAAQIEAVDIVVSITNTTVHMAGAIGKTVWTMLPFMPDWRYQLDRDDTAWYSLDAAVPPAAGAPLGRGDRRRGQGACGLPRYNGVARPPGNAACDRCRQCVFTSATGPIGHGTVEGCTGAHRQNGYLSQTNTGTDAQCRRS